MIEFGQKVLSFTEGMDQAAFIADALTYDATLRNLELIGEAATHIPSDVARSTASTPFHPGYISWKPRNDAIVTKLGRKLLSAGLRA